jgi:hypothetical protein
MSLEITTPGLGDKKKTVKDLVISALMYNHPLTLVKLTNSIKKKFSQNVTFQGVRRAVNALVENKVIEKNGKEYDLSNDWIIKIKEFVDKLYEVHLGSKNEILNVEALGDDMKIYTLPNLIESDKFWNKVVRKWFDEDIDDGKPKIYPQLSGHTWYVFGQMGEETAIFDDMKQRGIKFYILCNGNTPLDQWCKKYYEKLGGKFINNDKEKSENNKYFSIYKDNIIQTEHPKELADEINDIYIKAKNFQNFDATRLTKVLLKRVPIKIIVMKNALIAEQLSKSVMIHFKK